MRQELALQRVWTKREFAVIATAGAWTLYLALVAVRLSVLGLSNMREVALRHCLTAAIGAILTAALFWLLSRLERRPPLVQIGAARAGADRPRPDEPLSRDHARARPL